MNPLRIGKSIWRFLSRSFVIAGLPLIAWGLDDLGGFFSNPARIGFILIALSHALILTCLNSITPHQPQSEQDLRSPLGHFHADLFEFIYILVAFNDRRSLLAMPDHLLLRSAGLLFFLSGALVSLSASASWTTHLRKETGSPVEHPILLTSGLYRWIRYPKMLALLLECTGAVLIFRSWAGLVLLLPELASILRQISVMERIFSNQYRQAWHARSRSSKKLLPFLF